MLSQQNRQQEQETKIQLQTTTNDNNDKNTVTKIIMTTNCKQMTKIITTKYKNKQQPKCNDNKMQTMTNNDKIQQ